MLSVVARRTTNDCRNDLAGHPVVSGQRVDLAEPALVYGSYCGLLGLGKAGGAVAVPSFRNAVMNVAALGGNEKVSGVHTGRHVARVAHVHSVRYRTYVPLIRPPMSQSAVEVPIRIARSAP